MFSQLSRIILFLLLSLGQGNAWGIAISPDFDHFSTGFVLTGAHETVCCPVCHKSGVFSGTPAICVACHNGGLAEGKPPRHVQSGNSCDDCHVTTSFTQINMEHSAVRGSCTSCHQAGSRQGPSASHIPLDGNNCDACHGTLSWNIGRFSHAVVSSPCTACHNGGMVAGMPGNHPSFSQQCVDCHNEFTWSPAEYDHVGVGQQCSACHGAFGDFITRKPGSHPPTSLECGVCHRTSAWLPAGYDHSQVGAQACASCHNGTDATGPGDSHFTAACDSCHSPGSWTRVSYSHASPGYPDHGSRLSCRRCHSNNNASVSWDNAVYQPDCAGCHASDYERGPHKKYESPNTVYYPVSELRDCSGSCHIYTDDTLTSIKSTRNREHSARSGDF